MNEIALEWGLYGLAFVIGWVLADVYDVVLWKLRNGNSGP